MIRAFLLDIEGTTTPIDFVTRTLFPYARARLPEFLALPLEVIGEDLSDLANERAQDTAYQGPDEPLPYLEFLMDQDRKSTALKSIQGKIWQRGYESGEIKGEVYDDVIPAIERWRGNGAKVYIYSSGSVLAQKLLFGHLKTGSILSLIDGHYDTLAGGKKEPTSYEKIAADIGVGASEVMFLSDAIAEIEAASHAGMQTVLVDRTGQNPGALSTFDRIA
ncbi:MAG TPA: acireductone synthase [Fimbriimonadaceae bacterium]|nr:acireductone synthase [Fimbriimonadaceae bacterium]